MQDIKFEIEKIKVEGKSRQIVCPCNNQDSYLVWNHTLAPGRYNIRCDACRGDLDHKVVFDERREDTSSEDLLTKLYRLALQEIIDEELLGPKNMERTSNERTV